MESLLRTVENVFPDDFQKQYYYFSFIMKIMLIDLLFDIRFGKITLKLFMY